MSRESLRFWRYFGLAVPPLAAVMGAWTSLQAALDPALSHKGHLVWASLVRATAPAASGSALLLALVLWAQPLRASAVQAGLPRLLKHAGAVALPGYFVATGVALLASLALSAGLGTLQVLALSAADFAVGTAFATLDSALLLALSWRLLPFLQRWPLSLPGKLGLALAVTVPLRATVALVAGSALPS